MALLLSSAFFSPVQAQLLTGFHSPLSSSSSPIQVEDGKSFQEALPVSKPAAFLTAPFRGGFSEKPEAMEALQDTAPVDLQADDLMHDEQAQIILASGNVVLEQDGRRLIADRISYNLAEDRVIASGNVEVLDVNGDLHKADRVELLDQLKNGAVEELQSFLIDGSRFTASHGEREGAIRTVMKGATYTPCEVCEHDPDADPLWQLRASEITYDEEAHRIEYRNARFEFLGVPLAYTPYFSHPDGTVKRKSGFLSPSGGYQSSLGFFVDSAYYYSIASDKDATVGMRFYSKETPLLLAQWRQGWESAFLKLDGGLTYSDREDVRAGRRVTQDEEIRGHILGTGVWDLNEKWRAGLGIEYASDDQYLRQYDFSSEDILENELYAERFSGRNYAVGRILTFQDLRVRDRQLDQPEVVPEVIASFVGEPGAVPVLGGRWDFETSFLGLRREGSEQDMNRFSIGGGWKKRLVSDTGLLTNVRAHVRNDVYNVRDRMEASLDTSLSSDATENRFFPQAQIEMSYPLVRPYDHYQALIEPVVAVTAAPNLNVNDDIPNEDSQDIQIDASNLFEPDRFPGLDVVEDRSRMTYGVRTGVYGYDGSYAKLFFGQSRRFDEDDNPFPVGSGLHEQESDYVGELTGNYQNQHIINYKFQLSQDNLASQRHEADLYSRLGALTLGTRYLFAKALDGTDIDESREQLQSGASYDFTDNWKVRSGTIYDLGEEPGLREAYLGFDYSGQCISWSLTGERNLTEDTSGESDTEIMFRLGFKNLGDFETSAFEDYLDDDLKP